MGQIVMRAGVDSRTAGQPDRFRSNCQIVMPGKLLHAQCRLCDTPAAAVGVHGVEGLCYWLYIQYI